MRIQSSPALVPLLVLALSTLSACVDEKVVFEDPTDDPGEVPTASAGFIGYQDHAAKLTLCGNCHVGAQADWRLTKHSVAWENLQKSGHAVESCEGCHSTNELGNSATALGGFLATRDKRYEDVQCESCHGPGLVHAGAPSNANVPQAPLAAGTLLSTGCGECHRTAHTPFLEEWSSSKHIRLSALAANAECTACHSGDGALRAWGVNTEFAEQATTTGRVAVTCAVCHDPHGSKNPAGLRLPVDATSLQGNLCMTCHQRRAVPDPNSLVGPHSPQGPTLLGSAGWWPAGMSKTIVSTHGTPSANPGLCATCHVYPFDVKDASGAVTYRSTGHTFQAIPCLDPSGRPLGGVECADTQRSYASCTGSGCHANQDVARSVAAAGRTRIARLLVELKGLLDKVPANQFNPGDPTITVAEGASFNRELALMDGTVMHNPYLTEQLLIVSIQELQRAYGLSVAADLMLDPQFDLPGN
jgi:predicted CXXCH cytochrome family protein